MGCTVPKFSERELQVTKECRRQLYESIPKSLPRPGTKQLDERFRHHHGASLYSRTGVDLVDILSRVAARHLPQIQLGPVDLSCAMTVACVSGHPEPTVRYYDISPEFLKLYKCTREQVIFHEPWKVPVADDGTALNELHDMYRRAVTGEEQKELIALRRSDGSLCNTFISLIPLRQEGDHDDVKTHITRPVEWIVGFLAEEPETSEPPEETTQPVAKEVKKWAPDDNEENHTLHFVSSRGIVQYVSKSVSSLLGYLPEEVIGRHVEEICDANDMVALLRELKDLKNSRGGRRSGDAGHDDLFADVRLRRATQSKLVRLGDKPTVQMVLAEVHGILRMRHKRSTALWMEIVGRLVLQPSGSGRKSRTVVAVTGRTREHVRKAAAATTTSASQQMQLPQVNRANQSAPPAWLAVSPTGVILQCVVQRADGYQKARSHNESELPVRVGYALPPLMNKEAMVVVQGLLRQKFHPFSIPHWIGNTPVLTTWIPIASNMHMPELARLGASILVRLESQQYGFEHVPNLVFEPDLTNTVLPNDSAFAPVSDMPEPTPPNVPPLGRPMWWESGGWGQRMPTVQSEPELTQIPILSSMAPASPLVQAPLVAAPLQMGVTSAPDTSSFMFAPMAFNVHNYSPAALNSAVPNPLPLDNDPSAYPLYNAPGTSSGPLSDSVTGDLSTTMPSDMPLGDNVVATSGPSVSSVAQMPDMVSPFWPYRFYNS